MLKSLWATKTQVKTISKIPVHREKKQVSCFLVAIILPYIVSEKILLFINTWLFLGVIITFKYNLQISFFLLSVKVIITLRIYSCFWTLILFQIISVPPSISRGNVGCYSCTLLWNKMTHLLIYSRKVSLLRTDET